MNPIKPVLTPPPTIVTDGGRPSKTIESQIKKHPLFNKSTGYIDIISRSLPHKNADQVDLQITSTKDDGTHGTRWRDNETPKQFVERIFNDYFKR
ncbi:MAG: hypothetical protein VKJ06_06725 [Vampirovibrionales bacterium]|nr:hypothetical protein [Vampirovibrionales bacterium]